MIDQARKSNGASRIRQPTSIDYASQLKQSSNVPAIITISDLANNPANLIKLVGGTLEDLLKKETETDKRIPKELFTEYDTHEKVMTWHEFHEVTPGYTLLVYNRGKKTRELNKGEIRPSRRGITSLVEIYSEDIEHKINFPVLIVKTQTESPASISMTYRITDPEQFYRNRFTIENGGLKEMVKRVFNSGSRFISHEKYPSEISAEEYAKINQELVEDLRPNFAEKGIALKEAKFYIAVPKAERVFKDVEHLVRRAYSSATEIARLQREMQVRENLDEIPFLKSKGERDKVQREAEFEAVVDETRKELNLEVIAHETREVIEDERNLHEVKREKIRFELKKIVIEYSTKFFKDLTEVVKDEEDSLVRLSLLEDITMLGKAISGSNTEYRDFLGELFQHKLKKSELESQADAYSKTHPPNVEMARAFSGFVDELKVSLNDDKLKSAVDYISNLFNSPKKEQATTETIHSSSSDTINL